MCLYLLFDKFNSVRAMIGQSTMIDGIPTFIGPTAGTRSVPPPDTRRVSPPDPTMFHESLCRQSFLDRPVVGRHGKGIDAERAIMTGGTLSNGQLQVQIRQSHGVRLRALIAMVTYMPNDIVTCYGGFLERAPPKAEAGTHMRSVPLTSFVLNGEEFSNCFPSHHGAEFDLGRTMSMTPRCVDRAWEDVINSTGVGYMANTVTKCPLQQRAHANVTVHHAILGRRIPGVPYSSVVFFRAGTNGIAPGEPVISPYEACKSNRKFTFKCSDVEHYRTAGQPFDTSDDDVSWVSLGGVADCPSSGRHVDCICGSC